MTELNNFFDHPILRLKKWPDEDFQNPDAGSFHEMVCDLARYTACHPHTYSDMPPLLADALETINIEITRIFEHVAEGDVKPHGD